MSGISGGWLTWILANGFAMTALCILLSIATRRIFSGLTLIRVTTSLALLLFLVGMAAGMARSDFRLEFLVPHTVLAIALAAVWLLGMKGRKAKRSPAR